SIAYHQSSTALPPGSPYCEQVHDVHVWNVGSANAICTAHVGLKGCDNCSAVLAEAKAVASDMGISHSTFQLEACSEDIDEKERRETCCHKESCYTGASTCDSRSEGPV
ncbi:cation diffusion facilitator transporter, partial [Perkinsus olseni]